MVQYVCSVLFGAYLENIDALLLELAHLLKVGIQKQHGVAQAAAVAIFWCGHEHGVKLQHAAKLQLALHVNVLLVFIQVNLLFIELS